MVYNILVLCNIYVEGRIYIIIIQVDSVNKNVLPSHKKMCAWISFVDCWYKNCIDELSIKCENYISGRFLGFESMFEYHY